MKLYLFGWAETQEDWHSNVEPLLKLIENIIKEINPKQILHIPFARTTTSQMERDGDWFNRHIHLEWVEYLNATNEDDIKKANSPLIFISGGSKTENLLKMIETNPSLEHLIRNAKYIIGESAGAKVLWNTVRIKDELAKWLGILEDTIIEPHYTQRGSQQLLEDEMQKSGMKYGIWLDEDTWMEFDLETFPYEWKKIGNGNIEIKENKK